jgi:anaerobic selenocysteine-containing dehydrogenase
MSESEGLTRKEAVTGALAGAGAIALGAATEAQALDERTALFLGQDELPVPPKSAKVHTSACQYCNVGCGYKIYT